MAFSPLFWNDIRYSWLFNTSLKSRSGQTAIILALSLVLCKFAPVDLDFATMRTFFAVRGTRSAPKNVALIVISDSDYEAPLNLSPKYKVGADVFVTLLEKVLSASPAKVFVDEAELPDAHDSASARRLEDLLQNTPNTTIVKYRDVVLSKQSKVSLGLVPDNERLSLERSVTPLISSPIIKAPINIDNGHVYLFPDNSDLFGFSGQKRNNFNSSQAVINFYGDNFYGDTASFDTRSFTEVLFDSKGARSTLENGSLSQRIVFVGRASAIFRKGLTATKRYITPIKAAEVPTIFIQATMVSNLLDGSVIRGVKPTYFWLALFLVFSVAVFISNLRSFWLVLAGLSVHAVVTVLVLYQLFVSALLWAPGTGLILATPFLALFAYMALSVVYFAGQYYRARKDYFID